MCYDETMLYNHTIIGDVATVKSCLDKGVNINTRVGGNTPFQCAMHNNAPQVVETLLACPDLDITAATVMGDTGLHLACQYGSVECIRLLAHDRRMTQEIINVKNKNGCTPFLTAMANNKPQVVATLLACHDVDITATDHRGDTGLLLACYHGSAKCIGLLGQDRRMTQEIINVKSVNGNTALMVAVKHVKLPCVKEMAKLEGVDWETKTIRGESLEDVARRMKSEAVLTYLCNRKRKALKEKEKENAPSKYKKMKLSKLTQLLEENMKTDMEGKEKVLKDKHNKTLKDLEEEYKNKREDFEKELKEKSTILENGNKLGI